MVLVVNVRLALQEQVVQVSWSLERQQRKVLFYQQVQDVRDQYHKHQMVKLQPLQLQDVYQF